MKALVLGCGSIGIRHIGHLRGLGVTQITGADPDPGACDRAKAQYGIEMFSDPQSALEKTPDIVLVCTPAETHVPLALRALRAGAHVFVEKPLSLDLDGVQELMDQAESGSRVVQVGYPLRYHPAVQAARHIMHSGRLGRILAARAEFGLDLKQWWPGRDYRKSYMAAKDAGGGLLWDVSHEIDLLLWLLGPVQEVTAQSAKNSTLDIPGVDLIQVLLRMQSGVLASIHIDCLQPTYERGFSLIGEGTALRWRCVGGRADQSVGQLELFEQGGQAYVPVPVVKPGNDFYYRAELEAFLDSVIHRKPSGVPLEHGAQVLRVVLAIQQAIQQHRVVGVAP